MKVLVVVKWAGKVSLTVLWFLIVQRLGWESLWWAAPLSTGVILGAYAERDIYHHQKMKELQRRIAASISKLEAKHSE